MWPVALFHAALDLRKSNIGFRCVVSQHARRDPASAGLGSLTVLTRRAAHVPFHGSETGHRVQEPPPCEQVEQIGGSFIGVHLGLRGHGSVIGRSRAAHAEKTRWHRSSGSLPTTWRETIPAMESACPERSFRRSQRFGGCNPHTETARFAPAMTCRRRNKGSGIPPANADGPGNRGRRPP